MTERRSEGKKGFLLGFAIRGRRRGRAIALSLSLSLWIICGLLSCYLWVRFLPNSACRASPNRCCIKLFQSGLIIIVYRQHDEWSIHPCRSFRCLRNGFLCTEIILSKSGHRFRVGRRGEVCEHSERSKWRRANTDGGWTLALAGAFRMPTMAGTRLILGGGRLFSFTERAFFCISVCLYYVPSLPRSRIHTHPNLEGDKDSAAFSDINLPLGHFIEQVNLHLHVIIATNESIN